MRAWRFKTDDSLTLRQPRVGAGDIVTGKLGDRAFRVIKHANGGEVRFWTHIKPVRGVGGNRNQIVLFAQYLEHFVANMQAEQAGALDKKPHLVFAMGVLVEECFRQRLFLRVIGAQADDVPALLALVVD